jgi:hypothetical protein
MAAVILLRSPSSVDDKRCRLANAQVARPFNVGSWTKLRVAMRVGMTDDAAPAGNTTFMTGICSGTTNLPGDATCTHAVGVGTNAQALAVIGTTTTRLMSLVTTSIMTKIGTTVTGLGTSYATSSGMGAAANYNGLQRDLWFLTVTKGTPNWSFSVLQRNNVASTSDYSYDQFIQYAETEAYPTLTRYVTGTTVTGAIDEGANGTLDTVFFWWPRAAPAIEISDIAVVRFA